MAIQADHYTPLFQEYLVIACEVYPEFVRRLEQSLKIGMVSDVVEGMVNMKSNLGPDRYKALDTAYRHADEKNLIVLERLTGLTKKQWGQIFWGWDK